MKLLVEADGNDGGLDFGIVGTAIESGETNPALKKDGSQTNLEELLAGKETFDVANPNDNYRLKYNRELTRK